MYERGIALFKYPHVRDIWAAYLKAFVSRYGGTKLERARDLYEQAVKEAPPEVGGWVAVHSCAGEKPGGVGVVCGMCCVRFVSLCVRACCVRVCMQRRAGAAGGGEKVGLAPSRR